MWTSCRDVSLVMSKPEQRPADMALISSLTPPPPTLPTHRPSTPLLPHFPSLGGVFAILTLWLYCKHRQKQRHMLCKKKICPLIILARDSLQCLFATNSMQNNKEALAWTFFIFSNSGFRRGDTLPMLKLALRRSCGSLIQISHSFWGINRARWLAKLPAAGHFLQTESFVSGDSSSGEGGTRPKVFHC